MVCGDCQGAGRLVEEAGWVGSDVNNAISNGAGMLQKGACPHFKFPHLQTVEKKKKGKYRLNEGIS